MIEGIFSVGKIYGNTYVDLDPRWYIIVRECAKTVFVKRLTTKSSEFKDKFGNTIPLPGTKTSGEERRLTKQETYLKSHVEGPLVAYNGNYEAWEKQLNLTRQEYFKTK